VCSGFTCQMVAPIGGSSPSRCWTWRFLHTRLVVGDPERAVMHRVKPDSPQLVIARLSGRGWAGGSVAMCSVSGGCDLRNAADPNVWSRLYSVKAVTPYRLRIRLLPALVLQHDPPVQHQFILLQSLPSIIILYFSSLLSLDFCQLYYRPLRNQDVELFQTWKLWVIHKGIKQRTDK